jgi:hypothetical protein
MGKDYGEAMYTFNSMISLFLASRLFFSVSTSAGSADDEEVDVELSVCVPSLTLPLSFAGVASEYHLDATRVLAG